MNPMGNFARTDRIPSGSKRKTRSPADDSRANSHVALPPLDVSEDTRSTLAHLQRAGTTRELSKVVDALANAWAKSAKSQLGVRRGRPRKRPTETTGLECAAKVEGWLAVFHPAMERKRELRKKLRNLALVKEELVKEGIPPKIAEFVISHTTPFKAACAWVAMWAERQRSPETIANYSRRYRKLVWHYVPAHQWRPAARKRVDRARFVIDLAPFLNLATKNWLEFS